MNLPRRYENKFIRYIHLDGKKIDKGYEFNLLGMSKYWKDSLHCFGDFC